MTDREIRNKVIETAKSFLGLNEADGSHMAIINLYNSDKPLPRGYALTAKDSWCDAFVSVVAEQAGVKELVGKECGCEEHVKIFKKLGIWEEDGTITPEPADIIVYNWDDNTQPNDGYSDHIGYVVSVNTTTGVMKIIEGNKNDAVAYRNVSIGAGYIRGFAKPKYASPAAPEAPEYDYENLGWNKDGNGWWYAYGHNKGEYHVNNAVRIKNSRTGGEELYFFDTEGYCVKNPSIETEESGELRYIHGERV